MSAELKTHLIPFLLIGLGMPLTVAVYLAGGTPAPSWWPDLAIYLALGLMLFGSSSLYHLAVKTPLEETLNKVDHLGIHVMIAGTGMVHMKVLPAILEQRVPLMASVVWGLALVGMAYRLLKGERSSNVVVMTLYVAMALTIVPTIDLQGELFAPAMLLTYAGIGAYAASALLLFPHEERHAWWHLGGLTAYVLMGVPILL